MDNRNDNAISEIIGTVLLFAITVALFSVLYLTVIPNQSIVSSPSVTIVGYIEDESIILEHHGGETISSSTVHITLGGTYHLDLNVSTPYLSDTNENQKWDIGEKLVYSDDIENLEVVATVVHNPSNSVLFLGTIQDGLSTYDPYVQTSDPTDLTNTSATLWMSYNLRNYSGNVRFQFKTEGGQWSNTSWHSCSGIGTYNEVITNLSSETRYYYRGQLSYNSQFTEGRIVSFITTFPINTSINMLPNSITENSTIYLSSTGSNYLDTVSLWYRYSIDNISWDNQWWNTSFSKRKSIFMNVSNASGPNNYTIKMNISYDSDMQETFDDLRFIRYNDNETELDYWVETKKNGSWAQVWVKCPDKITSSNQILAWMYYGNSSVHSTSNGTHTFLLFDDFLGSSYDSTKWETNFASSIEVSNGILSMWGNWNTGGHYFSSKTLFTSPIIVESKAQITSLNSDMDLSFGFQNTQTTQWWSNQDCVWCIYDSNGGGNANRKEIKTDGAFDSDTEVTSTDFETHTIYYLENGVHWFDTNLGWLNTSRSTFSPFYFSLVGDTDSTNRVSIDHVFIRTYHSEEPAYQFGSEETIINANGWSLWSDGSNPDASAPWSWNFTFPHGSGYYEFYSIGAYNIHIEEAPDIADESIRYNDLYAHAIYHWDFDEGNGNITTDIIEGYTGTIYGAQWTTGISNTAVRFDGDDHILLPDLPDLSIDFTITVWINTTDNTEAGQRIFCDDEHNSGGFALSIGDPGTGAIRFYSRDMDSISLDTSQNTIQNDQWYFIAGVANITGHRRHIYVDSIEQAVDLTDTGEWGEDTGSASIGGETDNGETQNRFIGYIDELIIYDTALTTEEIIAIYHNQRP